MAECFLLSIDIPAAVSLLVVVVGVVGDSVVTPPI